MPIKLMGFNNQEPYSLIIWQKDGVNKAKTVCYTAFEEHQAINRFNSPGDLYSTYDKAIVIRDSETIELKNIKMGA